MTQIAPPTFAPWSTFPTDQLEAILEMWQRIRKTNYLGWRDCATQYIDGIQVELENRKDDSILN